jgi:hypothetical protein
MTISENTYDNCRRFVTIAILTGWMNRNRMELAIENKRNQKLSVLQK